MTLHTWLAGLAGFAVAFLVGTLLEYAVHRLMHAGKVLYKTHARHHQSDEAQGWYLEFKDYFLPSLAIIWVGFLHSLAAGAGFAVGAVVYAALAAYAHQVQHENPELVFWLPRPVHHLHHRDHMWKHNFGILVDFWDRVFGTYKPVPWSPARRPLDYPLKTFFQIKWF